MTESFTFTIVTGADSTYMPLLLDLIHSIRDNPHPPTRTMPIAVLDFGLTDADRQALCGLVQQIVVPDWDIAVKDQAKLPGYFRGFTVRPFLRKYFPGFDVYLWIDSDCWVQDGTVLDIYLRTAWSGKMAATPQIDRCYKSFYKWQRPRFNTLEFRTYHRAFGWRLANRLGRNPFVNCGVFSLRSDAPHWDLWATALRHAFRRSNVPLVEQAAFNHVIYHDRAPTGFLPAWANWVCIDGPPMLDESSGAYVEPQPPHRLIGILHLLGPAKDGPLRLPTSSGGVVEKTLRYSAR